MPCRLTNYRLYAQAKFPRGRGCGGGLSPVTLDRKQYFALILFKLQEIW